MSRKSGRERHLTEKGAALKNGQSKQKPARVRESKGKSNGNRKRRVSSSSSGESETAMLVLDKDAHTSRKSKKKSVKRRRKMVEEVIEEHVQDEDEDDVVEAEFKSPSPSVIDLASGESADDAESTDGELSDGQSKKFKLRGRHCTIVPKKLEAKKDKAADIRTIFSDLCIVKFVYSDSKVESLKGRWCEICRSEHV